jgi:hypothetical protein
MSLTGVEDGVGVWGWFWCPTWGRYPPGLCWLPDDDPPPPSKERDNYLLTIIIISPSKHNNNILRVK